MRRQGAGAADPKFVTNVVFAGDLDARKHFKLTPVPNVESALKMLEAKGVTGIRLSCQMLCDHDMSVRAISRLAGTGRPDAGPTPQPTIEPPPVWTTKAG